MTLAGGFDYDGHGFGLHGGAVVGPQVDVEGGVGRKARRYCDVYVAFRVQRVDRRVWLRGQPDRSGPVAPAGRDGRSAVGQRVAAVQVVVKVDEGGARNGNAGRQAGRADIDRYGPGAVQVDFQLVRPAAGGVAGGATGAEFVGELPAWAGGRRKGRGDPRCTLPPAARTDGPGG